MCWSSKTRTFIGPDGIEYKWKFKLAGTNPMFPEMCYRTLYAQDSEHPIATTERLADRDISVSHILRVG